MTPRPGPSGLAARVAVAASLCLLISLVSGAWLAGAEASPSPISGSDYVSRLDAALADARRGEAAASPQMMDAVRTDLGLPVSVELRRGTVDLPKDSLLESLKGSSAADFRAADAHLQALLAVTRGGESSAAASEAQLRPPLARALSAVHQNSSLAQRVRAAIDQAFVWFLERLVRYNGPISLLLWIVFLALPVAAAVFFMRPGSPYRLVPERVLPRAGPGSPPADWHRLAEEALAAGDLDAAVRAWYRALLARLAARGVIPETSAITAGECRRAVSRTRPGLSKLVDEATITFERVAFGGSRARPSDVEALRRAESAVAR